MDILKLFFDKDTFIIVGVMMLISLTSFLFLSVGSFNIGLDGSLVFGVFGYTLGGFLFKSLNMPPGGVLFFQLLLCWLFVLISMLVFGFFAFNLRFNLILVGIALNALWIALANFVIYTVRVKGALFVQGNDYQSLYKTMSFLYFKNEFFLPFLLIFAIAALIFFFLYRTSPGLRIRSVERNPKIIQNLGFSPLRYQYLIVLVASVPMALACLFYGEYSPSFSGKFTGLGFLALLITAIGESRIIYILGLSFFFGLLKNIFVNLTDKVGGLWSGHGGWLSRSFLAEISELTLFLLPFLMLIFARLALRINRHRTDLRLRRDLRKTQRKRRF